MKTYTRCNIPKEEEDFYRNKNCPGGRSYWCKQCVKARGFSCSTYSKENRKRATYKYEYGITPERYDELFKQQNGKCAICKESFDKLDVDHCHKTSIVRGLLCGSCNRALGLFKDDIKRIQEAINYLSVERKVDIFEVLFAFGR